MMQTTLTRILLADDHRLFRQGIEALLSIGENIEIVGSVGSGKEAVSAFEHLQPDILLVDLKMPGMDGVETTRQIIERSPQAKILILTTFEGEDDIHSALEAGASGFLLKDCDREELLKGIESVIKGELALPIHLSSKAVTYHLSDHVSPRERDVLRLLANGMRNKDIAENLSISEGTVKIHLNKIFKKIGAQNRSEAILKAHKKGLVPRDFA